MSGTPAWDIGGRYSETTYNVYVEIGISESVTNSEAFVNFLIK